MTLLIDLLGPAVVGASSNALWDLVKRGWQEATRTSRDELYLDSFRAALEEQRPHWARYTRDGQIALDTAEVSRVLHRDLGISADQLPLSALSDEAFMERLASSSALFNGCRRGARPLREVVVVQTTTVGGSRAPAHRTGVVRARVGRVQWLLHDAHLPGVLPARGGVAALCGTAHGDRCGGGRRPRRGGLAP